jgi:hypothetical protein
MGAVSSKSRPSKSMRVATIFTGVAAATVGMTQVANAQDVTHAAHKPTSKRIGHQLRPASQVLTGRMQSDEFCHFTTGNSHPNWLHVFWYNSQFMKQDSECYGFSGFAFSPPTVGITYMCGGNNYGSLFGHSDDRKKSWVFNYGPGTTYAYLDKSSLYQVHISRWAGNDKCPDGFPP